MAEKTISVKEAADILGVCRNTIYTMCAKGEIPHIQVRGRRRFREDTIRRWMDDQEAKAVKTS